MKTDIQSEILDLVRRSHGGRTIEAISKDIGVSRVTASKYLAILQALGKVRYKEAGRSKVFFFKDGSRRHE